HPKRDAWQGRGRDVPGRADPDRHRRPDRGSSNRQAAAAEGATRQRSVIGTGYATISCMQYSVAAEAVSKYRSLSAAGGGGGSDAPGMIGPGGPKNPRAPLSSATLSISTSAPAQRRTARSS